MEPDRGHSRQESSHAMEFTPLPGTLMSIIGFQVFGYGRLKRILKRQEKAPQTLRTPSLKVGARSNELAMAAVGVEQRDLSYYGGGGQ